MPLSPACWLRYVVTGSGALKEQASWLVFLMRHFSFSFFLFLERARDTITLPVLPQQCLDTTRTSIHNTSPTMPHTLLPVSILRRDLVANVLRTPMSTEKKNTRLPNAARFPPTASSSLLSYQMSFLPPSSRHPSGFFCFFCIARYFWGNSKEWAYSLDFFFPLFVSRLSTWLTLTYLNLNLS